MTSPGHKRHRTSSPIEHTGAKYVSSSSASSNRSAHTTRRAHDNACHVLSYTTVRTPPFAASLPPEHRPSTPPLKTSTDSNQSFVPSVNSLASSSGGHAVSTPVQLAQSCNSFPSSSSHDLGLTSLLLPPATAPAPGGAAGHYAKHTFLIHDVLRHTSLAEMRDREVVDWLVETNQWLRRVVHGQHRSSHYPHHSYPPSSSVYAHTYDTHSVSGGAGAELRFLVLDVLHTMPWWRLVEYSESPLSSSSSAGTDKSNGNNNTTNGTLHYFSAVAVMKGSCSNNKFDSGSRGNANSSAATRSVARTHRRIQLALEQMCVTLVEQSQHTVPGVLDVMMKPFRLRPPVQDGARRVIPSNSVIRLLGTLAARYPRHYVMDWLHRCVAALVPKRRWVECRHHVACAHILLALALDSHVPSMRQVASLCGDLPTDTASVLRSLSDAWQLSDTNDVCQHDNSNSNKINGKNKTCNNNVTSHIRGLPNHSSRSCNSIGNQSNNSRNGRLVSSSPMVPPQPAQLQPNKMILYRSELLSFLLQWLLEMEITLDRAEDDDEDDNDVDRLTDNAADDTASWSSSCGSCYSSSWDGSRLHAAASTLSVHALHASFGPRGGETESNSGKDTDSQQNSRDVDPGVACDTNDAKSHDHPTHTRNNAMRGTVNINANNKSKNQSSDSCSSSSMTQATSTNRVTSYDNASDIVTTKGDMSGVSCDELLAEQPMNDSEHKDCAARTDTLNTRARAEMPMSNYEQPATYTSEAAETTTMNSVRDATLPADAKDKQRQATNEEEEDEEEEDVVARQFSPHARPFLYTLRVCTTFVFAKLATDARRQRQGGGGGACSLPEWWSELLRFHLNAVLRIERPVCLLYLVPSLAMLGVHEESVDVLHKLISLVTKGYISYCSATGSGNVPSSRAILSAAGVASSSAMGALYTHHSATNMGSLSSSAVSASSGIHPYAFSQSAGGLLASASGPAASAVRMRMPAGLSAAAAACGGGLSMQSVSLPQRLRAARIIFPMFRFMYARLSGAEGVYRRLLKWVAQATATAMAAAPRKDRRMSSGAGYNNSSSSASAYSAASATASTTAERAMLKRVHAPPRLVRVLFAQCAAMAQVLDVPMELMTLVTDTVSTLPPTTTATPASERARVPHEAMRGGEHNHACQDLMRLTSNTNDKSIKAVSRDTCVDDESNRKHSINHADEDTLSRTSAQNNTSNTTTTSCTTNNNANTSITNSVSNHAERALNEKADASTAPLPSSLRAVSAAPPRAPMPTPSKDWVMETLQPLIQRYRLRDQDELELAHTAAGSGVRVVHTPVRLDLAQMQKEGLLRPTLMDGCVWREVLSAMLGAEAASFATPA